MFTPFSPTRDRLNQFLATQRDLPFSYREVEATRAELPSGYNHDHNRIQLGNGQATFVRAVDALRRWEVFNLGWAHICWPDTPIEPGATVAFVARTLFIRTINACRIVYVIDEDEPVRRFGFAYGTLPRHIERGEERFSVELHRDDDSVWYDIRAFSRPRHILTWLGYPFTRMLQHRFVQDSKQAMLKATSV